MNLNREDMLRELELLPMWRLRVPPPAMAEVLTLTPSETEAAAPTMPDPAPPAFMAEVEHPVALEVESVPVVPTVPIVTTPWLLYCPQPADAAGVSLLNNIMQAMRLPAEQVTLYQQPLTAAQAEVTFAVLFGLEAANTFLQASHDHIDSHRNTVHRLGNASYVITHHPQDLLQHPQLKKEVWSDLCLLIAKNSSTD